MGITAFIFTRAEASIVILCLALLSNCNLLLQVLMPVGIFTARTRSCGNVMFYTCLSAILFTGGMHGQEGMHGKGGGVWQRGACMVSGHVWPKGACMVRGCACVAGEMATAAGSTHPTRMYSCYRVATAQGKQGIWLLLFPDRENTGNFALTQGKILRHRENIFL